MKKIVILLAAVMLLSLTGCEDKKPVEDNNVHEDVQEDIQEEIKDDVEDDIVDEGPVEVDIYVPDDNYMKMETEDVELDKLDADNIIKALIDEEVLPEGCKSNSMTITNDNIELDLNAVYGEHIRGMGTTGEYFSLGCTVNTFLNIYDKEAIKITVDGAALESGHAVYEGYLTRFNTEP